MAATNPCILNLIWPYSGMRWTKKSEQTMKDCTLVCLGCKNRLGSLPHTLFLLEVVPHGMEMGYALTFATPTQTQVLATSRCTRIGQNESKIRHRPQWALFFALAATIPLRGKCWWKYVHKLFQNVWFGDIFSGMQSGTSTRNPETSDLDRSPKWRLERLTDMSIQFYLSTSELQMLGCVDEHNMALSTWGVYSCLLQTCAVLLPMCWI